MVGRRAWFRGVKIRAVFRRVGRRAVFRRVGRRAGFWRVGRRSWFVMVGRWSWFCVVGLWAGYRVGHLAKQVNKIGPLLENVRYSPFPFPPSGQFFLFSVLSMKQTFTFDSLKP